jgi:hypothetical protein
VKASRLFFFPRSGACASALRFKRASAAEHLRHEHAQAITRTIATFVIALPPLHALLLIKACGAATELARQHNFY